MAIYPPGTPLESIIIDLVKELNIKGEEVVLLERRIQVLEDAVLSLLKDKEAYDEYTKKENNVISHGGDTSPDSWDAVLSTFRK